MTLSIELSDTAPKGWNDFLKKHPTGNVAHTVEYSQYAKKRIRWMPIFCRVLDETGGISLQCLVLEQKNNVGGLLNRSTNVRSLFKPRWRWSFGPVSDSEPAIEFFYDYIYKSRKKMSSNSHPFLSNKKFNFNAKLWATYIINLKKTKETIFSNMDKKSARKNINKAIENNITVEKINETSLKEYHTMLTNTRSKSGAVKSDYETLQDFWKFLKPVGITGFLAKKDGVPLAGISITFFNKYINEVGVGRSELDHSQNFFSQDLIKWKTIEWGIDNNMDFYDLSGHNPNPTTRKEIGIKQFKKKWGGDEFHYFMLNN